MPTPYRADHVGSLLRPPELLEARAAYVNGTLSLEGLREVEDAAVLRALAMQRDAGIDILSDGEYRRPAWSAAVRESLEGSSPTRTRPSTASWGSGKGRTERSLGPVPSRERDWLSARRCVSSGGSWRPTRPSSGSTPLGRGRSPCPAPCPPPAPCSSRV